MALMGIGSFSGVIVGSILYGLVGYSYTMLTFALLTFLSFVAVMLDLPSSLNFISDNSMNTKSDIKYASCATNIPYE